ncbi:MAG: carbamoyl phosphate synthase large subunit, partial [Muribaculaceae bacterium]|nr:carbamoyl phosphate synthase large subunit [Muribaculaceae bacterium]
HHLPSCAVLLSSVDVRFNVDMLDACRMLFDNGYKLYATAGTAAFLADNGIEATKVNWPDEEGDNNVLDLMTEHKVDLVINIPKNHTKRELTNGYKIRRMAIDHNIPLITNARLAGAYVRAFINKPEQDIEIRAWQEY